MNLLTDPPRSVERKRVILFFDMPRIVTTNGFDTNLLEKMVSRSARNAPRSHPMIAVKKIPFRGSSILLAEGQGFEPWVPYGTAVFKTAAINRSAIPPERGKRVFHKRSPRIV